MSGGQSAVIGINRPALVTLSIIRTETIMTREEQQKETQSSPTPTQTENTNAEGFWNKVYATMSLLLENAPLILMFMVIVKLLNLLETCLNDCRSDKSA